MKRAIALALCAAAVSSAANFTFSGQFTRDDQVALFSLQVGAPSNVTVQTLSFAGGINALGDPVPNGGFAPVLSVFNPAGLLIGSDFGGGGGPCGLRAIDPVSGFCWDAYLSLFLSPGTYTLALSQDDNLPLGPFLSDGFTRQGEGNFTGPNFLGTAGSFILISGQQRSSRFDLDVLNVRQAEPIGVPEPGTWITLFGLAALLSIGKRKSRSPSSLALAPLSPRPADPRKAVQEAAGTTHSR